MQEGKAMRTDQWTVQAVVTESQGSEKLKMLARFLSIFPFFFFFFFLADAAIIRLATVILKHKI